MSNLVAIIPARGGSKRFPGKNLAHFKGKPLLWHAIDAVGPIAQTVIVASDSAKILDSAQHHPDFGRQITVHSLDSSTTEDTSTVLDSVLSMLERSFLRSLLQPRETILGLFLPTAPLRTTEDVEKACKLLTHSLDGVISVTDYEFPPQLSLSVDSSGALVVPQPYVENKTRSQEYKNTFRPNGAIYLQWGKSFLATRNFFRGVLGSYYMPRERSIDIDTEQDLKYGQ